MLTGLCLEDKSIFGMMRRLPGTSLLAGTPPGGRPETTGQGVTIFGVVKRGRNVYINDHGFFRVFPGKPVLISNAEM